MRPRQLKYRLWGLTVLAVLLITGIGVSARAAADPVDDYAYLTTLDHFQVFYSSDEAAISVGHSVCDALDVGLTVTNIAMIAVRAGYTPSEGGYIVGAAIGAYCDEYGYLLEDSGGWLA